MQSLKKSLTNRLNIDLVNVNSMLGQVRRDAENGMSEEEILEKARSGRYKDTPENRKAGRVGQNYGETKKDIEESVERAMFNPNISTNSESRKPLSQKINELSKEDQEYVNQNYEKFRDFAISKMYSPISEIVKQYKEKYGSEKKEEEQSSWKSKSAKEYLQSIIPKGARININDNLVTVKFELPDASRGQIINYGGYSKERKDAEIENKKVAEGILSKLKSKFNLEDFEIGHTNTATELFVVSEAFNTK